MEMREVHIFSQCILGRRKSSDQKEKMVKTKKCMKEIMKAIFGFFTRGVEEKEEEEEMVSFTQREIYLKPLSCLIEKLCGLKSHSISPNIAAEHSRSSHRGTVFATMPNVH